MVNARENNLDHIYTLLHHFLDDFMQCFSRLALGLGCGGINMKWSRDRRDGVFKYLILWLCIMHILFN